MADEKQAIELTRAIVGVAPGRALKIHASTTTFEEDNTPFLSHQLIGRPLWQVVIDEWKLELDSYRGQKDKYDRTLEVLIDPENGSLLKVISRWPKNLAPIDPEPPTASAEDQMRRAGNERYHSFPPGPPEINLREALNAINDTENPLEAKQILATYVSWSQKGKWEKPRAIWAITLRGIPPLVDSSPGIPERYRNRIRYIVDPKTKRWLCATTTPQPDLRWPRKKGTVPSPQEAP